MDKSSVFYIFLYIFLQICCERGAKSHVAKEISGRGRTRSREKGNQGIGDFRFINILQLNFFYLFFFQLLCFIIFFYTFFTHEIYPHPRPKPTTQDHYPRPTTFSYTRQQSFTVKNSTLTQTIKYNQQASYLRITASTATYQSPKIKVIKHPN